MFDVLWAFLQISRENRKIRFSGIIFGQKKPMDSVHGAVDRGATGPPWTGGHCHTRELTGARPLATPMSESSGQGSREGKEGPASSTVGSPWVRRRWRGISPATSGSAKAVTTVELRSGGNERGRTPGQCEGGGVLGHLL
jgi:hypothetical protein